MQWQMLLNFHEQEAGRRTGLVGMVGKAGGEGCGIALTAAAITMRSRNGNGGIFGFSSKN